MKKFLTFLALACFMVTGAWAQWTPPFEAADSYENITHWYALNAHSNKTIYLYTNDASEITYQEDANYAATDKYAWGFVGNSSEGYTIYNKATGKEVALNSNEPCTLSAEGVNVKWTVEQSNQTSDKGRNGFCIKVSGQSYVNFQKIGEQSTGNLLRWTDNDAGSTFTPYELDLSIKTYTVNITGAPSTVKITYKGAEYGNNDEITASGLVATDIVAENIDGYNVKISIDGTNINVTYSVHVVSFPDAGTHYVTLTNKDTGNRPYIYNALSESTYTLQSATPGTTNNYIWKVVSDGAGNISSIVNGDGRGVGTNGQYKGRVTSLQYKDKGDGYYYLYSSVIKAVQNDHECLNRSNGGYKNANGDWTVTTWVGENRNDNLWKVETVDVSALNVYNVVVTGANGYVTYSTTSEYAYNGGFFLASGSISETDLVANAIPAYNSTVSVSGTTITVAYEADQSQLELNALIAEAEAAYASNDEPLAFGDNLITANSQFSSNATEPNEGSLGNLLDSNLDSFWHSQWSAGDKPMHTHYLQVALNEPISGSIQMTMGRRNGAANDHPLEMSVEYSTSSNGSYTRADGSMAFTATTGYVTGTFNLPTDAQYLRFYVDKTDKMRGYWHCSEFQLNAVTKTANLDHPTEAATLLAAIATAKAITSGATQADVQTLQNALNAYENAVNPTPATITYVYKIGEEVVGSEAIETVVGADIPAPTKTFDFYTQSAKPTGYVTETTSYTINLTWAGPFEFTTLNGSEFAETTKWYYMQNGNNNANGYVVYGNGEDKRSSMTTTSGTADTYKWCFVRKANSTAFYLYNKAAGATALHEELSSDAGYAANHNQGFCVAKTEGANDMPLVLVANGTAGYTMKLAEVSGTCILGKHVGSNLSIWGNSASVTDNGSRFTFEEALDLPEKTYAFVLTDAEGNEYEGTFTSSEENARPECVEGFTLSNEGWEDVSDIRDDVDYVYTAEIEFPFPVNTPTAISGYKGNAGGNDQFWWHAVGTDIVVKKNDAAVGNDYAWVITPNFVDNTFFYTINSYTTGKYVKVNVSGSNHSQGAVTLDETANATYFTYTNDSFKVLGATLYLSVNSSNTATEQYVGVHTSIHAGSKMHYGDVTSPSIEITIGETGYATIAYMEDFVKPEGLKVYYCIDEGDEGHLTPVEWEKSYIPAYFAFILEGTPGTYSFKVTNDYEEDYPSEDYEALTALVLDNVLIGNLDDTDITVDEAKTYCGCDNIYVFSKKNGKTGFYTYVGSTLAAHKAFYAVNTALVNGFIVDFEGTEGINAVMSATNLKAGYDIQGRRINKVQKGINILSGKKIIK